MSTLYLPFDGQTVGQSLWREMMANLFTDGRIRGGTVAGVAGGDLLPTPGSGLSVVIANGCAIIRGFFFQSTTTTTVTLNAADPTNDRYDYVVLRLDMSAKTMTITKITGTAAALPFPPALTNTSTVMDLPLALVLVAATATSLSSGDIATNQQYATPAQPYTPVSHEGDTDLAGTDRSFIGSQGMVSGAVFYRNDGLGTRSEFGFGAGGNAGDYGFYTETPNANITDTTIESFNRIRNARWDGSQYVFIATGRKAALEWMDNSGLHIMHSTDASPVAGNPVTWSSITHLASW